MEKEPNQSIEQQEVGDNGPVEVESFEEGLDISTKDVKELLTKQEQVLISVSGKTGSGKSEFTRQLGESLEGDNMEATLISSDDFYVNPENVEEKRLDIEKLQDTITRLQKGEVIGKYRPSKVIVVEGVQVIDNEVLGQKPDQNIYVEADFNRRMGRKLLRDKESGYRSIKEQLGLLAKLSVDNPDRIREFEDTPDVSDVDLLVHNSYEAPGSAGLYVEGNKLIFSVEGGEREELEVSDEQIKAMAEFGVETRHPVSEQSPKELEINSPEKEGFIESETLEEFSNGFELLGIENWQPPNVSIKFIEPEKTIGLSYTEVKEDEINIIYDKRFITENEDDDNSLLSQLKQTDFPGVQQVFKHELAHVTMWSVTGQERQPAIRLLDEGWASLIEHASVKDINSVEELIEKAKQDVLEGLGDDEENYNKCLDFNDPPSQYKDENLNAAEYTTGRAVLLWIRENYGGNESMIELLKNSSEANKRNDKHKQDEFNEQFPKETIVNLTKKEKKAEKIQWEQEQFKKAILEVTKLSDISEVELEFRKWLDK